MWVVMNDRDRFFIHKARGGRNMGYFNRRTTQTKGKQAVDS